MVETEPRASSLLANTPPIELHSQTLKRFVIWKKIWQCIGPLWSILTVRIWGDLPQDCCWKRLEQRKWKATDRTLWAELRVMFVTCDISKPLLLRVENTQLGLESLSRFNAVNISAFKVSRQAHCWPLESQGWTQRPKMVLVKYY